MKGTEKQISFATDIINKALNSIKRSEDYIEERISKEKSEKRLQFLEESKKGAEIATRYLESMDDAALIISRRHAIGQCFPDNANQNSMGYRYLNEVARLGGVEYIKVSLLIR